MQAEKFNVNLDKDCPKGELIIREVNKVVEDKLPVLEPEPLSISGTISSIANFLEKRWGVKDQIDHTHTYVAVDRDALTMRLVCNETDTRYRMEVNGSIKTSRQYDAFHINDTQKAWEPIELGNFLRVNRTYFENINDNMDLVTKLKHLTATVKATVDKHKDDNGSMGVKYFQAVDSSLPKDFTIKIPIFKGSPEEKIKVEFDIVVNGSDFFLHLISADAASLYEGARDNMIDAEIKRIEEIAPEIPIIEQ